MDVAGEAGLGAGASVAATEATAKMMAMRATREAWETPAIDSDICLLGWFRREEGDEERD